MKKVLEVEILVDDEIKPQAVTLADFIIPEFRGKNPDDYEFRGDGKIVRKDRWQLAVHSIRNALVDAGLLPDTDGFEIEDVVTACKQLMTLGSAD